MTHITLEPYQPSTFDSYAMSDLDAQAEQQGFLVAKSTHRDANGIDSCNYDVISAEIHDNCSEDDYMILRASHWLVGWCEVIVVRPDSPAHQIALKALAKIDDYPILDEDLYYSDYAHLDADGCEDDDDD